MALRAPVLEHKRELPKAGNQIARCWMVCDLGFHESEYQGEKSINQKVKIAWELPKNLMQNGEYKDKPFSVMQDYTLSMGKKANLRKMIESWQGVKLTDNEAKEFDLMSLVGDTCLINVFHKTSANGNTYANISSVTPLIEGIEAPEMINKPILFSLEDVQGMQGGSCFNDLPDWLKKMINLEVPVASGKAFSQDQEADMDYDGLGPREEEIDF